MREIKLGLSYNDVALVPVYNNIPSRLEPSLKTKLTSGLDMEIPIVAANMDTVIGEELTQVMLNYGSIPIHHRFWKAPARLADLIKKPAIISWGVGDLDNLHKFLELYQVRPLGVCVDIAHGHSKAVMETIEKLRKEFCDEVIAGNVCTARAVGDLAMAGATAVKVGIGPGSVCLTRSVTAFGTPQFTAVQECAEAADRYSIPAIADGGIKGSRDIILALAAGASSVMIGGLLARTQEASGKGTYRGQASREFQEEYYGEVKKGTVPEGIEIKLGGELPKAAQVIEELLGGVRSGMTYGGARTIEELQRKAEFIRITENYWG